MTRDKMLIWADLLMYYGILVFCATIPFSIALATGGLFGGSFGWILRCILQKKIAWKYSPLDTIIVIFLAMQALSIPFSMDCMRSLNKFRSYWHILPFALLLQSQISDKRLHKCLGILIASGILSALLGIGQYWAGAPARISGTFGMYMTYAGILAMIWALALFQSVSEAADKRLRLLCVGALAVIGGALVLCMTRIAMLAVLMAAATLLALRYRKIFALAAVLALAVLVFVPSARKGAHSLAWGTQTPTLDTNVMIPWAEQRPYLWKGAYRIIKEHPWTGVGLANFRNAYKRQLPYQLTKTYNHAHNNFLQVGAETGLPGLAAFVVLQGAALLFLLRAALRAPDAKAKALLGGVLAAFMGFHVAGLFEFNFGDSEVAMLFWFILGMGVVVARRELNADASRPCP